MLDRYNIMDERDVHDAGEKMERYLAEKTEKARERKVDTKLGTVESSKHLLKSVKRLEIQ